LLNSQLWAPATRTGDFSYSKAAVFRKKGDRRPEMEYQARTSTVSSLCWSFIQIKKVRPGTRLKEGKKRAGESQSEGKRKALAKFSSYQRRWQNSPLKLTAGKRGRNLNKRSDVKGKKNIGTEKTSGLRGKSIGARQPHIKGPSGPKEGKTGKDSRYQRGEKRGKEK